MSYSDHRLNTVGKVTLLVPTKNKYVLLEFEIVKDKSMSILERNACLELNLISRLYSLNCNSKTAISEEVFDSYSDVFEGLCCLPTEYKIRLDKNAKTVINHQEKYHMH